jgi:uncharacterized protein DUF6355
MIKTSRAAVELVAASLLAAGTFSGLSTASTAEASTAEAPTAGSSASAARICGFWKDPRTGWAWYTHCLGGGPYTRVLIKIVTYRGPGSYLCVRPGSHGLGPGNVVRTAYYTGRLC